MQTQMSAKGQKRTCGYSFLLAAHFLEVTGLPRFVEPGLQWSVKPQQRIPAFTGHRLHPVALLACWGLRSEPHSHRTVSILFDGGLVAIYAREFLVLS